MSKDSGLSLADRHKKPSQKIDWALKLLQDKGRRIGEKTEGDGASVRFEIDGKMTSIPEVYRAASKFPDWNDRLGLGTATLRRVK